MISVVICSANSARTIKVRENIAATIGVAHEIIVISNAKELGGMCAGYNTGAEKATYDFLCFVHDDVEFLTKDWGKEVIAGFSQDNRLGLIGIAGSRYKSKTLSGWWTGLPEADCCSIFQRTPKGNNRKITLRPPGMDGKMIPVRTLDGVLLCMPKKVWQQYPFNTKLKGFHFYDLDISLRISQHYTVAVVYNIDLVHFSPGGFGDEWVQGAIRYHEQENEVALPCSVDGILTDEQEKKVCFSWLQRLRLEHISKANRERWVEASGARNFPGSKRYIAGFFFPYIAQLKMKLITLLSR